MVATDLWLETLGQPPISNEIKLIRIKHYRDELLLSSDWTQLPDTILNEAERTAWQDYRQALRDIPQDFINPDDVIFPTRPQ